MVIIRKLVVAMGLALLLGAQSCTQANQGHGAASSAAMDLRLNAEAFRITAAADFPRALLTYGAPQTNLKFVNLAKDMWPGSDGAQGLELFFSTALVDVARADQPTATVAYYQPWSDVMVLTSWSKGQDGRYRIGAADVVLGAIARGAKPPYPTSRAWQTANVYAPEAVGQINAQTTKAFEAAYAPNGPGLVDKLDPRVREAMPAIAAMPLAEFRLEILPLIDGGAAEPLRLWRQVRAAALGGPQPFDGDRARAIAALRKLDPKVRASMAPVALMRTDRSTLVILASRIDPDLFLAMQLENKGGQMSLRQLTLLSFQSFYDAAGKQEARP
jgi:hypothetical protein